MARRLTADEVSEMLYQSLPAIYREYDKTVKYALKRYLQVFVEGGFQYALEETNGILDLYDPDKTAYKMLKYLYKSFGFDMFNDVSEFYQRKMLREIGELYKRKGSEEVVRYISSLISGANVHFEYGDNYKENFKAELTLDMDSGIESKIPTNEQLARILKEFLPFFMDVTFVFAYNLPASEWTALMGDVQDSDTTLLNDIKEDFINQAYYIGTYIYIWENSHYDDKSYLDNHKGNIFGQEFVALTTLTGIEQKLYETFPEDKELETEPLSICMGIEQDMRSEIPLIEQADYESNTFVSIGMTQETVHKFVEVGFDLKIPFCIGTALAEESITNLFETKTSNLEFLNLHYALGTTEETITPILKETE